LAKCSRIITFDDAAVVVTDVLRSKPSRVRRARATNFPERDERIERGGGSVVPEIFIRAWRMSAHS